MTLPLYVLGHRNPDTDAVCSAAGYAALLRAQGTAEAVAGRLGPLRRETAYVLERFGVDPPAEVTDVRPRVADVMTAPAITVDEGTSLLDVARTLEEKDVRAVAVVDGGGHLRGVTGVADFAQAFVRGLHAPELDTMPLDIANVVRALDGRLLVDAPGRKLSDRVMVAAMAIDSMLKRIEPDILLVVGDRADVQRAAIEFGVGALVVTGDNPVEPEIVDLARRQQVYIIAVGHHTSTTLRLIQLSTPVQYVMRRDVMTCSPDDLVDDVRGQLGAGTVRALVVVDGDGMVRGVVSRSNLLRPARYRVALVDHNERGQAVEGIEEADVVAVVDHHRVADLWTRTPPFMRFEPVGATSTLVAKLFREEGMDPPPGIAGVLLSGILADTLLFRGPTTTDEDRRVAAFLAGVAGVDVDELGEAILDLASDVSDRSARDLLTADFKEFTVDGRRFGIGTIETTNGASVLSRRGELLDAMTGLQQSGHDCVIFAVVDIVRARTILLVQGEPEAVARGFEASLEDGNQIVLPGIISRKKNIVPRLSDVTAHMR